MSNDLKLYCQNCCARYSYCIDKDSLHPYDRAAETCPDFLPKDIYKSVNQNTLMITNDTSSCYRKRLSIDPDFRPLPENIPLSHWTKERLEEAKAYAIKMMKEPEMNKK
jgi:hypothetical protein